MRLYRVSANGEANDVRWEGSKGAASKARTALMEEHGLKRTAIDIDEVDVPVKKELLLGWLNEQRV